MVNLPDDVVAIGYAAFKNCNFTNFLVPSSVTTVLGEKHVESNFLEGNNNLVSLELSKHITKYVSTALPSLRNIAIPSKCTVDVGMLGGCTSLRFAFPDEDDRAISIALKHRFDELPIHKICYYQSYHDKYTSRSLKHVMNSTDKRQDCLGMTPLHILACSIKPTIEMYRLLIEKYPDTLIMKDKWGDIPLLYAFWCNAPAEIVNLLVESYKSLHPDFVFDWKGMLETLAKRDVPLAYIQNLVNMQRVSFPDQEYDIQAVVLDLVMDDSYHVQLPSGETIIYLLRVSIAKRLNSLAITRWSVELEKSINKIIVVGRRNAQAVYQKLATYESIKEGTYILELAIWKANISSIRNKRARVDGEVSYKQQCRINCRADIVIRNVLPYLLPK